MASMTYFLTENPELNSGPLASRGAERQAYLEKFVCHQMRNKATEKTNMILNPVGAVQRADTYFVKDELMHQLGKVSGNLQLPLQTVTGDEVARLARELDAQQAAYQEAVGRTTNDLAKKGALTVQQLEATTV